MWKGASVRDLQLQFEEDRYPVWMGVRCLDEIVTGLAALQASSYHIVTDVTVGRLHAGALAEQLAAVAPAHLWTVGEGEAVKAIATVERLAQDMVRCRVDRGSVVVAVGGGVVGNLAGLLAALLFRGIRLVHVPTTLIAAADSVASMKQAVNLPQGKNLLGCFHKPEAVMIDVAYLHTLPAVQMRSGMCEIIKNALTVATENLALLDRCVNPEGRYGDADLRAIVEAGLLAKQKVMLCDKRERRQAIVFEYGHTVGHAVELASGGAVPHGLAVGMGMLVAAEVSFQMGLLPASVRALHHQLLRRNGVRFELPPGVTLPMVMNMLMSDNKRGYLPTGPDQVAMILLRDLGVPHGPTERPLTLVDASAVADAITRCQAEGERMATMGDELCHQ
jgi:3-dehydroquinate synthetase